MTSSSSNRRDFRIVREQRVQRIDGLSIDSGVDALVLKTPPYFFPEHAAAAVQAGCHVCSAPKRGVPKPK